MPYTPPADLERHIVIDDSFRFFEAAYPNEPIRYTWPPSNGLPEVDEDKPLTRP